MEPAPVEIIAPVFAGLFLMFIILVALTVTAIKVWVFCRIFAKAGYSWALGLLMLVPIADLIVPIVLAFSNWPILKEIQQLKQQQNMATA